MPIKFCREAWSAWEGRSLTDSGDARSPDDDVN